MHINKILAIGLIVVALASFLISGFSFDLVASAMYLVLAIVILSGLVPPRVSGSLAILIAVVLIANNVRLGLNSDDELTRYSLDTAVGRSNIILPNLLPLVVGIWGAWTVFATADVKPAEASAPPME